LQVDGVGGDEAEAPEREEILKTHDGRYLGKRQEETVRD
jgi:hypothetical protein